jgi:hypothetical protein
MIRWETRKEGKMIGSSSRASQEMGLMRSSQNLVVERRQQGKKMGINIKRENGFGSSLLAFALEREGIVDEETKG